MKKFNFYEIAALAGTMGSEGYRHDTIGLLDRSTGHCVYVGHADDTPCLEKKNIDLCQAVFIRDNGHLYRSKNPSPVVMEEFLENYLPELLPVFKSVSYPFDNETRQKVDYAFYEAAGRDVVWKQIDSSGLIWALNVYLWCKDSGISLLAPEKARALFVGYHEGFTGHVEHDEKAGIYHGEVIGCSGVVTFQAEDPTRLQDEFRKSINTYLECCKTKGIEAYLQ